MINRKIFFYNIRSMFAGQLGPGQEAGITAIIDEWEAHHSDKDLRWLAYMLATTYHETARTMQPVEEYGKGHGRPYGRRQKQSGKPYADTGNIFYGRGFVQLTWYENYQKAGLKLDVDLLAHPEQALQLPVATKIMFAGMMEGWFTGKKLGDYFHSTTADWVNARRIINGLDKADLIAGYGRKFYTSLA